MTPSQDYARLRVEAEALIRTLAPQQWQDRLVAWLKTRIGFETRCSKDDELVIGASKFAGSPDVPANFEWPSHNGKSLGFLAQFNLEEIAPFDIEGMLPKRGLLSFFLDFEEPVYNSQVQRKWQVAHFDGDLIRREIPQDAANSGLNCAAIVFSAAYSLPCIDSSVDSPDLDYANMEDEEADALYDFMELEWYVTRPQHWLLSYPASVQSDVRLECQQSWKSQHPVIAEQASSQPADWRLLLEFEEDQNVNAHWGDTGAIYFCIRQEDLQVQRFENCEFVFQCH